MRPRWLPIMVLAAVVLSMALFLLPKRKGEEPGRVISVTEALGGEPGGGFTRATAPRRFSFPADHGPHPGFRTEWWYFTGNLKTTEGHRFGYQLTFFRVALKPWPAARRSRWGANEVFMAHFAVTDVDGKRFHYAERFSRAALGLAGAGGSHDIDGQDAALLKTRSVLFGHFIIRTQDTFLYANLGHSR